MNAETFQRQSLTGASFGRMVVDEARYLLNKFNIPLGDYGVIDWVEHWRDSPDVALQIYQEQRQTIIRQMELIWALLRMRRFGLAYLSEIRLGDFPDANREWCIDEVYDPNTGHKRLTARYADEPLNAIQWGADFERAAQTQEHMQTNHPTIRTAAEVTAVQREQDRLYRELVERFNNWTHNRRTIYPDDLHESGDVGVDRNGMVWQVRGPTTIGLPVENLTSLPEPPKQPEKPFGTWE